jgi:RNA polymerase sigma factor (sigma-70 family)
MVEANLGLVYTIGRTHRGRGAALADLIQEGTLGLIRAVERFDPDRGVRFSSYAGWWIRRAVLDAIGAARTIRLPAHAAHDLAMICDAEAELGRQGMMRPSNEELATRTGLSERTVGALRCVPHVTASLEEPVGAAARPLNETIGDPAGTDPLQTVSERERRRELANMLRLIPPRHRQVLIRRFGLDGWQAESHREIGAHLGVKEERSRQLEREALHRLRALAYTSRLAA